MGQFIRGFTSPFTAFSFIKKHNLWALAAAAIAVNVLFLMVTITASISLVWPMVGALVLSIEGLFSSALWLWIAPVFVLLTKGVAILMLLVANAFVVLTLGQAVASPFLDLLSERTEALLSHVEEMPMTTGRVIRTLVMALADVVWVVGILLAVNIPMWLLGFWFPLIPAVVLFLLNANLLAVEFIGLPMTRDLMGFRKRWRFVGGERSLSIGFGCGVTAMLCIPGLNLLLLPLATVGGTQLYCEMKRERLR